MFTDELTVRVLGMKREDCFALVALEMDVWGYGESLDEAVVNLEHHIKMQITYLVRADKVELVQRPARSVIINMYNECFISRLKNESMPGWWIYTMTISRPDSSGQVVSTVPGPAIRYAAGLCLRSAA